MTDCCGIKNEPVKEDKNVNCPMCGNIGRKVETITLKSLLLPDALARLEPRSQYSMCTNRTCDIVYFSEGGELFKTSELKVPVFQKSADENCPVCYCFGWTRKKIRKEVQETGKSTAISTIAEHIKAGRCGCEVNNPQGSCCLGNVKSVLQEFRRDRVCPR